MLSVSSRVFKLPKRSETKGVNKQNALSQNREHSVKIQEKDFDSSEFSTDGSETGVDSPSLNLGASKFYVQSRTSPYSIDQPSYNNFTSHFIPKLESEQIGVFSDSRLNSGLSSQSERKGRKNLKKNQAEHQQATVQKPRKKFTNNHEKEKFVESYKKKKKTELCKNWELSKKCKFGSDCAFAHGEEELVTKSNLPGNYKTKQCKQFHEDGYCPYGNRCQFLHLIIQKDVNKFGYSDILKETIFQFESRSKIIGSESISDLMIKPMKTKRLSIFEAICGDNSQSRKNSDESAESIWDNLASQLGEVKA